VIPLVTARRLALVPLLLLCALLTLTAHASTPALPGMPDGRSTYADLVTLFDEFLQWTDPERAGRTQPLVDQAGRRPDVYPDYGRDAIDRERARMREFQTRLADMGVARWERPQQVDYLAVRAKFDEHDFLLNVTRPWFRDPGFYVDQMLRITFTPLPAKGDARADLERRLKAIPQLVAQAKRNLTEVAADYADLAIHNLEQEDGVNHGYPYRATPPPGVIGWYADFAARAKKEQPTLVPQIQRAQAAVVEFRDWLKANRPTMTGKAGVGREQFDWYVRNVKLMPFTSDQMVALGTRELNRLWALYALEQHRNRKLPPLELATSAQDYRSRIAATDARIRRFLVDEEIISIPPYIAELPTNVPWMVRPGGPNFWEQIQYRDPTPDHLHAVIPGHNFDGSVERHTTHPIRARISDGVRVEGWGVYLEEAMLHAGLMDATPRVRELIYIFGIFRAVRINADVWLQLNEMKVDDAVSYWMKHTPYLDKSVARVDAEIYIRQPPGYGLGYTMGMLQMQQLLGDRKRQLGDAFVLKDFHDTLMKTGRLPMSLIRWEMTGLDDEVKRFWVREPMPAVRAGDE
jgi:hypothetical protein